jgi:hypothetical protein
MERSVQMLSQEINRAFLQLGRRAENYERSHLVSTFVDIGPLFTMLSIKEDQILYGRRGTGKTHAFYYLAGTVESQGDISIQIDMRTIGSSGGIYSDSTLSFSERATRLLIDTLSAIHESLLNLVILKDEEYDLSRLGPCLDRLADAITQVEVVGNVEQEDTTGYMSKNEDSFNGALNVTQTGFKTTLGTVIKDMTENSTQSRTLYTGTKRHRVNFGSVRNALTEIINNIDGKHIWLLLDEWSEVPLDLQPYLADLLRRSVFPVSNITVKIAAIEQRCKFRIITEGANYIGIEVGADAATSLNLDEYMVFDNDANKAKEFFRELIFRHISPLLGPSVIGNTINNSEDLIQFAFTQLNVFDDFVRSAEGVPRDAINILSIAAQKAVQNPISISHIRVAAKTWYNRAKESAVNAKPEAHHLLRWIIDEVIAHRRARAFLLRSDVRDELIDYLFDARVLHVVKESISAHDQPGVRFNVYGIDYGCYVDLINTTRAPQGLFQVEHEDGSFDYIEVPVNDYRSIRRAILDLEIFRRNIFLIESST